MWKVTSPALGGSSNVHAMNAQNFSELACHGLQVEEVIKDWSGGEVSARPKPLIASAGPLSFPLHNTVRPCPKSTSWKSAV